MIDELRIWTVERSNEDIQNTLYSQPQGITGLYAWYKFDEFSGNRARDYAGSHHALLVNMDTFRCFKTSHVWDAYNQKQNNALIIYAGYDPDYDDEIRISFINQPFHGVAQINERDQSITYYPANNYVGDDIISFELSDGRKNTTGDITIHINHIPEILETISDFSLTAGDAATNFNITLNDLETSADAISISASSSLPLLVDIQITGSGNNRTVSLTPADNMTGETEITLYINDGMQISKRTFVVTVQASSLTDSGGLSVKNRTFLKDLGDNITLTDNAQGVDIVVDNIPAGVTGRLNREWQINMTDINDNGGQLAFIFDFSDAGYSGNIYDHFVLLKQSDPNQDYSVIATPDTPNLSDDRITFLVDASQLDSNAFYTLGISRGGVLIFDGQSGSVDCGSAIILDPIKDLTIEAWFRAEKAFDMLPIVSKGFPSTTTEGYALYVNSWRTEDRRIVFETQNNLLYTDAGIIEWGNWYHVAVVIADGVDGKIYVNGMPVHVNGSVALSTEVDTHLYIGSIMDKGWFFKGQMDEIRLWNRSLSASEIRDRMFVKINLEIAGLSGCWGFNESAGNEFLDQSGNNNTGYWSGQKNSQRKPGILPINGLYSQHRNTSFYTNALSFDSNGYVSSSFKDQLNQFTVEAWVKSSSAPSDSKTSYIFDKGQHFRLTWDHPNVNYRGAVLMEKNASIYAESFGLLKRDTWYHLAATYDGSAIKTYKNGELIAINTNLTGTPTECDMPFTLGTNFTGLIADVRLWDVALSGTQIQSQMSTTLKTDESNLVLNWLFNAGKDDFVADLSMNDRHGKLIDMPSDTWTVMDAENYTPSTVFLFHNTDVSMNIDSQDSASVNVTKMPGIPHNPPKQFEGVFLSQYWVIDYFGSAPFSASITFTVAETIIQQDLDVSCSIKLLRRDETSGGLWKIAGCSSSIDALSHAIRIDNITQGGQYILGRTNGIPVAGSGKAVVFAGNETNFIIRDLFEQIPESLTIEWFMNASTIDNASQSFQIAGLDGPDTFSFHTSADGAVTIGNNQETAIKTSAGQIIPNTWQHIAFTYEQGIGKLYINGTLIQTQRGMAGSLSWKGLIGSNISGQLDELRIWEIARTAAEIRSNIYTPLTGNESGLVSYYQMDQPSTLNLMDTKDLFHGDIQYPNSVTYILSTAWAKRIVNSNGALSIKVGYDFEGSLETIITDPPSHGNISINNTDALITYTVENNYSGTDVFSYEINDGLETDAYTITILTNSLPQLSEFPEEIKIPEGMTSFSVPFQLTDLDTNIDLLNIYIESSDPSIIDPSLIVIDGTGANRQLLIQTQTCKAGFVTLNLMLDDGYARTENEIHLLVESAYHDGPGGICSTEDSIALWLKADSITGLLNGTPYFNLE
ncbi:MAG: hypothetical protein OMM_02025 [Candidatus Magnetoglobus multicellularis str. Araruama]|uniref:LamG-like jellyroll fold domain-containing protein n=1 Tax=Candidatus Magnetoglobus multicellularis str. Araruama TaxID=890399 RepID=A0A1V1PB87_9BACT|nr:MAG: hypothetical protein OMM_02025 [Candidatus Magnetoglobus multicellularis str. Araruama]